MKFYSTITFLIFTLLGSIFQSSAQYGLPIDGLLYLKGVKKPLKGMVNISRKSNYVIVYEENKTERKLLIDDIDSLKTYNNQLYIVKKLESFPTLFEVKLGGHISLLHLKKKDKYFFLKSDTLHSLNREKFWGLLNAYFPDFPYNKNIIDLDYKKVSYDDSFLVPFIQTYNQEKHSNEKISIYNTYSKLKIGIAPYLGISNNTSHINFVNKSFSYASSYQPNYGIAFTITGNSKFSFGLDLYQNKFERSLSIPKEITDDFELYRGSTLSYFSFNNLFFDVKFQYNFKKYSNQRMNPFLFIGPSFGLPLGRHIQTSVTRTSVFDPIPKVTVDSDFTQDLIPFFTHVGINLGGGIDYSISQKYAIRLQAKYQNSNAVIGTTDPRKRYGNTEFNNKSILLGVSLVRQL